MGDDVLTVIDSLGLTRPILGGHSIAGQEMSSIASRHPEKVAGLGYLEAAYFYAYYDRSRGNLTLDALDVQRKLDQLQVGKGPADQRPLIRELLNNDLPQLEKELRETLKDLEGAPHRLRNPHHRADSVRRKRFWMERRNTPKSRCLYLRSMPSLAA